MGAVSLCPAMKRLLHLLLVLTMASNTLASQNRTLEEGEGRNSKAALGIFNVVTFPNSVCTSSSGYNGTCYTATECTSLGGTTSGTCAQSFGICCVFTLACGGTTTQNNSYAIMSSYSTTSDADPCKYTICKCSTDVCKIRIDFDTMVLSGPYTTVVPTRASTCSFLLPTPATPSTSM